MRDLHIPDMTFPMVKYGTKETPWDLRILLYKGAAKAYPKSVIAGIVAGNFGPPIVERLELVKRLHSAMTAKLVGGGSRTSAFAFLKCLREFFAFADRDGHALGVDTVEATYHHWCDFLLNRVRLREITEKSAYVDANLVSSIIGDATERSQPLISTTPIRMPRSGARAIGAAADKQNLADTFTFAHLCLDVIESTSVEAILGPLPLLIQLRSGNVFEHRPDLKDADPTLAMRYPLANLRIEAELLVFIAQTGMNVAQAHQLKLTQFSYKSTIDGYEVRDYKHRRQGEVLFEIFSDYKAHFECYLAWRNALFANEPTNRLFPFVWQGATGLRPMEFRLIRRSICPAVGISFVSPQKLRKTRVNWLLRRSRDAAQTAEQAQHTKETLLRVYEQPSLQVAQTEIIQFWQANDPRLGGAMLSSPAPGVCDGTPQPVPGLPAGAPKPDCSYPGGCLFCSHHRDIDSEDYVWSMASMRYLNTVILKGFRPAMEGGSDSARQVELAIEVLTVKMKWFRESNATREAWVTEATARIAEDDFHPHWRHVIESAEGL